MSHNLLQSKANAEAVATLCATTPGMNALQPIAASAVEICTAAQNLPLGRKQTGWHQLSGDVVNQTEFLINKIAQVPLSPEICQALAIYEEKLDAIRRHVEKTLVLPRNKTKFLSSLRFKRETRRMKADLKSHMRVIVAICDGKSYEAKGDSEDILEYVSVGARAVGAICDVPVLNVMKPVVGVATLICDTAKCVRSNREAALDISARARTVTRSVVERAAMDGAAVPDPEALDALKLALEDIQSYLTALKKPRNRFSSWFLANQEKEQFAKLDGALDKAVAAYLSWVQAMQALRAAHTTATLVTTVERFDTTLTVIQADLGRLSIETPISLGVESL
ncbi:hypothetical protein B0H11DRAFT_2213181 [Mycena galericulata]|nr:hypothetical protein B0H11DRAFT_2213181 [Mycena galericulata]